jgi:hypothetical protein
MLKCNVLEFLRQYKQKSLRFVSILFNESEWGYYSFAISCLETFSGMGAFGLTGIFLELV